MSDPLDEQIQKLSDRQEKLLRILKLQREIREIVHSLITSEPTMEEATAIINHAVCRRYAVNLEDIMSRGRSDYLCVPRHMIWLLLRMIGRQTWIEIGRVYKRHHGAIIAGAESINDRMKTDKRMRLTFESIQAECENKMIQNILDRVETGKTEIHFHD